MTTCVYEEDAVAMEAVWVKSHLTEHAQYSLSCVDGIQNNPSLTGY